MGQFKQFLIEGGNAIKLSSRINQKNVFATLEDIYKNVLPEFKIKKTDTEHFALLGSAGKKRDDDSSGDLDLAISVPYIQKMFKLKTEEETIKKIEEITLKLGRKIYQNFGDKKHSENDFVKISIGLLTFSLAYPISNVDGKQDKQFVQLDLMLSNNIDLVGWSMSAPHYSESKFKGSDRPILLSSIIKNVDKKIIKKDVNGEPLVWTRYYFDLKNGLFLIKQERQLGKNGKYLKNYVTTDKKLITKDKDKLIQFLFGNKHDSNDTKTYEQVWDLLNSKDFKFPNKRNEILKDFNKQ